jgi:hypothetical protein
MSFKSSKGRDAGKELEVFRGSSSGQGIGGGGVAAPTDIQASGGAITEPGNGFKYHVFLTGAPGSFEVESGSGTIGVLCVAGGGGLLRGDVCEWRRLCHGVDPRQGSDF